MGWWARRIGKLSCHSLPDSHLAFVLTVRQAAQGPVIVRVLHHCRHLTQLLCGSEEGHSGEGGGRLQAGMHGYKTRPRPTKEKGGKSEASLNLARRQHGGCANARKPDN